MYVKGYYGIGKFFCSAVCCWLYDILSAVCNRENTQKDCFYGQQTQAS